MSHAQLFWQQNSAAGWCLPNTEEFVSDFVEYIFLFGVKLIEILPFSSVPDLCYYKSHKFNKI